MATSEILGLFQTPDQYAAAQDAAMQRQFIQRATLDPFQKASVLGQQAGYSAAQGIGGALGGKDPQLEMISRRNVLLSQLNPSDPSSYIKVAEVAAQMGDPQFAVLIAQEGRKAESERSLVAQRGAAEQASLAQAAKTNLTIRQEEELRSELSKLGPDATQDQVISVLTKYGPPEKVLAALTAAQSRTEATQAKTATSEAANQARIDAAKVVADAKIEAARMAGATAVQIAQMRADSARELRMLATSLKGPKVLSPLLQKEEDKELELVDSLTARSQALQPALTALTLDPQTKKVPLELGPLKNLRYQAQNAAGNSTPESQKFAELERAVQAATNLKTDAAKGVQTDKDVLRFANELIAAFGKYDTTVTRQALEDFVKATDKARENAQKRIDSRRTAQGVEPYYGSVGTTKNPIKLD
jgi:hypothetical protein